MILWIGLIILGGALLLLINHESGTIAGLDNYDFAAIAQYSALVVLISAGIVAAYRGRLKDGLKHALIWALVALGLITVYAFRRDFFQAGNQVIAVLVPGYPAESSLADGSHEITLRQRSDGHFVANVRIEDTTIPMLVDTGASSVVLTARDAARIGIRLTERNYSAPVSTANGTAMAAPVRLHSIAIGSLRYSNVAALVTKPGALSESLLGNTFLEHLVSYEVRGDTLVLRGNP